MTRHKLLLGAMLAVFLGVGGVAAQKRTTERTPKPGTIITDPNAPPAPRIITSSEEQAVADELTPAAPTPVSVPKPAMRQNAPAQSRQPKQLQMEDVIVEQDTQRRTINKLANNVAALTAKINAMETQQRQTLDFQRLVYAEQRAENLRQQLFDTQNKELDAQRKVEENEFYLRPEMVERIASLSGSTRPDEVRDQRRKALETERTRLQTQLATLQKNRERLELAVAQADREVDKLRERLDKESDNPPHAGQTPPANGTRSAPPSADESPREP